MQEKLKSVMGTRVWHLRMTEKDDVYRASPYEFAETADSCLQVITVGPGINVGRTITYKSPLSDIPPSSIIFRTESD